MPESVTSVDVARLVDDRMHVAVDAPTHTSTARTRRASFKEMRDAEVLEHAVGGCEVAWTELHSRHAHLVRRAARRMGIQPADVADVCQRTWMQLFRRGRAIRDRERVRAWLATTARRESIRLIAQADAGRARCKEWHEQRELLECGSKWEDLPESLDAELDRALCGLPERYRLLLRLMLDEDGLSYATIAHRLQIPIGSIGPMRQRAFAMLRRAVRQASAGTAA